MTKLSKTVKSFKEHPYQVKVGELQKEVKIYKEMIDLVKSISADAKSVSELEFLYNEKTGFLNSRMSFLSFNLQDKYDEIKRLEGLCKNIDKDTLTSKLELKESYLKALKEEFTTYYTVDELKQNEQLEKVIKMFNDLDHSTRMKVNFNYKQELGLHAFAKANFY